jgi:hypothetical protein
VLYIVHKPIVRFVIMPVAVAGILMLAILAATGNAQHQSNNAANALESNNHHRLDNILLYSK